MFPKTQERMLSSQQWVNGQLDGTIVESAVNSPCKPLCLLL